jgi:phosphohistidine phosphatase
MQRPLNSRGTRDAVVAGRWIESAVGRIDHVIVSPALRTRQTADLVLTELSHQPNLVFKDEIYEAEWSQLATVITQLPTESSAALLIGHNPGMEDLCRRWPTSITDEARSILDSKFPTCTIARLTVTGSWNSPQEAHLGHIEIPRA